MSAEEVETREFTLRIALPKSISSKALEIPAITTETLNDLKQALQILPATRILTNYDVYFGKDNVSQLFDEITTYEEILKDADLTKVTFEIRERAYNLAAVYDQIIRFRDVIGLHYFDVYDESGASRFSELRVSTSQEVVAESKPESEEAETSPISEDTAAKIKEISKNFIASTNLSDHSPRSSPPISIPIRSFTISQWAVPSSQRTKGDLLYLTLQTLENEILNITCHFSGFYLNSSSTANFNPSQKGKSDYLLYNLVSAHSKQFSKVINDNDLKLGEIEHPESYLLGNLSAPWLVHPTKNYADASRYQLPLLKNGVDGSDYIRDWNADIQLIRELPNNTFQERVLKEKIIHKNLAEFTKTATETAINIIKGNLTAMDPSEDFEKQIYLKNGIFYTSGSTTIDIFEATGGIEAARYTANKDIQAIKILNRIDSPGVHSLVTTIVDYMGRRVICQAPVPGIFEAGDDEKVSYGLSSDNTSILRDESFNDPLTQIAETFHLKSHDINGEVKSDGKMIVSKDTKGIKGSDGRKYVIDLYRTVPRDIEFTEAFFDGSETSYPHGEGLVRHEAVSEWWKRQITTYIEEKTATLSEEEKAKFTLPTDKFVFNPDTFSTDTDDVTDKKEVRDLSRFVKVLIEEYLEDPSVPFDGTHLTDLLHKSGINMRYLGYFAEQIDLKRAEKEASEQEQQVKLLNEQQEFAQRQLDHSNEHSHDDGHAHEHSHDDGHAHEHSHDNEHAHEHSLDNEHAHEHSHDNEHSHGHTHSDSESTKEDTPADAPAETSATFQPIIANYNSLKRVTIQEMIARASKHILRTLSSTTPIFLLPELVAHFHNCLLSKAKSVVVLPEDVKKFVNSKDLEFASLTSEKVFKFIKQEVYSRYRYTLSDSWASEIQPTQLLREIALKFGIQWKSQDYFGEKKVEEKTQNGKLDKKAKQEKLDKKDKDTQVSDAPFSASDIINFIPLVKDSDYKSSIIDEIFQTARAQEKSETTVLLLNELMNIQEQIYGVVSPETVNLYTLIAQLFGELGMPSQAALIARKAIIISERTTGFDSYDTVTAYMNSGYYETSNSDWTNSLRIYKQAFSIWYQAYGTDHPNLITTLSNIAGNLMQLRLYSDATQFYEQALKLSLQYNGKVSEITGSIYHSFALLLLNLDKFKESLELFRASTEIFTKTIGHDDVLTKQLAKYADSISKYFEYLEVQKKQDKELKKVKQVVEKVKPKKSTAKKISSDPTIAAQSVDDILKFIEGGEEKKKKKKRSKK